LLPSFSGQGGEGAAILPPPHSQPVDLSSVHLSYRRCHIDQQRLHRCFWRLESGVVTPRHSRGGSSSPIPIMRPYGHPRKPVEILHAAHKHRHPPLHGFFERRNGEGGIAVSGLTGWRPALAGAWLTPTKTTYKPPHLLNRGKNIFHHCCYASRAIDAEFEAAQVVAEALHGLYTTARLACLRPMQIERGSIPAVVV